MRVVSHTAFPSNKKQTSSHTFHQPIEPEASFTWDVSQPQAAPGRTLEKWAIGAARPSTREDASTHQPGPRAGRPAGRACSRSCPFAPLSGDPGRRTEDIVGCQTDRKTLSLGAVTNPSGPLLTVKEIGFKGLIKCILLLQKSNPSSFVVATEMTN